MKNITQKIRYVLIILTAVVINQGSQAESTNKLCVENLVFGTKCISNPLIIELINSEPFQRLKQVDQHGILAYQDGSIPKFSRFDHSIGVYLIADKFSDNENEKVSALLHDISHSAFSHSLDSLFNFQDGNYSYQDSIHLLFLKAQGVDNILRRYGIGLDEVDPKNPKYTVLEQSLPDLCADRIEYTLESAVLFGKISTEEAKEIYNNIAFDNGKWYFNDVLPAESYARLSLYFTKHIYSSRHSVASGELLSKIVRQALDHKVINELDVRFGGDENILRKLLSSQNARLIKWLEHLISKTEYCITDGENTSGSSAFIRHVKFRGVDPWVKVNNKYLRLTEISEDYKQEYLATKNELMRPFRFLDRCQDIK